MVYALVRNGPTVLFEDSATFPSAGILLSVGMRFHVLVEVAFDFETPVAHTAAKLCIYVPLLVLSEISCRAVSFSATRVLALEIPLLAQCAVAIIELTLDFAI